jgi:hypothetical protein
LDHPQEKETSPSQYQHKNNPQPHCLYQPTPITSNYSEHYLQQPTANYLKNITQATSTAQIPILSLDKDSHSTTNNVVHQPPPFTLENFPPISTKASATQPKSINTKPTLQIPTKSKEQQTYNFSSHKNHTSYCELSIFSSILQM